MILMPAAATDSRLAIQAAMDGVGVAAVQREYVREHLRTGTLVAPFDLVAGSENGYYLVWSAARPMSPGFQPFLQWVLQEAGRH